MEPASGDGLSEGTDAWFRSGTPLSNPSDDDARTEVAWDLWSKMRNAAGSSNEERLGKTVVASGSRLIAHLPSLLRLDPCMSVAVRAPGSSDTDGQALVAALGDAAPREGTSTAAAQYLQDWSSAADGLATKFSRRVFVGDRAAALAGKAT